MSDKVVITDYSLVSPLGWGKDQHWQALKNKFIPQKYSLDVDEYALAEYLYSNIVMPEVAPERIAVVLSNSKYNFRQGLDASNFLDKFLAHNVSRFIASKIGSDCLHLNVAAACATGLLSVIKGVELLSSGQVDLVLSGSLEVSKVPLIEAAFSNLGVLSKKNKTASFSKDRDGFILGEGGALFVLQRKADVDSYLGVIAGSSYGADAYDTVAFGEFSHEYIRKLILNSLTQSNIDMPNYINAHGTATKLNDEMEIRALADWSNVPISSTKPLTGHLLGGTGSVELGLCMLALEKGMVLPNMNLQEPIAKFNFVKELQFLNDFNSFLTLNYGFGGHIAIMVVTKN